MTWIEDDTLNGDLHDAISRQMSARQMMLNRWVLVVETVDVEGARATWVTSDPELQAWEAIGLLEFGSAAQRGEVGG